jgi:hypothetical protein
VQGAVPNSLFELPADVTIGMPASVIARQSSLIQGIVRPKVRGKINNGALPAFRLKNWVSIWTNFLVMWTRAYFAKISLKATQSPPNKNE